MVSSSRVSADRLGKIHIPASLLIWVIFNFFILEKEKLKHNPERMATQCAMVSSLVWVMSEKLSRLRLGPVSVEGGVDGMRNVLLSAQLAATALPSSTSAPIKGANAFSSARSA